MNAFYESHRSWKPAPIIDVLRTCVKPEYETLAAAPEKAGSICITTFTDEKRRATMQKLYGWRSFSGVMDMTWKNKQNYANKHGYQLFDGSDLVDNSRPPGWSKVPVIRRLLKEENCTWVFFLDADTVIMDSNRRLEEFLPADPTKHIVMAPDKTMKNGYNSGAWFLRNSEWGLELLERWWKQKKFIKAVGVSKSGDQAGLNQCLKTKTTNEFEKGGHGVAPRQCNFNSFTVMIEPKEYNEHVTNLNDKEYFMSEYYYHKGDFIAHAAGVDNKEDTVRMFLEFAV